MSFRSHPIIWFGVTNRRRSKWSQIVSFSSRVILTFDRFTVKNNRVLFLWYVKLCASFRVHRWIQTGVIDLKHPLWVKISDFFPCDLGIWRMTLKTIRHLFYATASYVHYFVAICEIKLKLRSGKAQIGANFALTSVTLTFDFWHWPFPWTSLLSMVMTPENFMMMRWQKHREKGVTDGRSKGKGPFV